MNCDEAFEQLTDPAHRNSAELDWHLERCPRCRQMQDVLAPALNLFDEPANHIVESPPLSSSGFVSTESILMAERTAAELSHLHTAATPTRRSWMKTTVKYAAVFLLGGALVLGITNWGADREPALSAPPSECLWTKQSKSEQVDRAASSKNVVLSCVDCHLGSASQ